LRAAESIIQDAESISIRHAQEERNMIAVRQHVVALFVDRVTQQWIVRDPDGQLWSVSTDEDGWERRQPYEPTDDADLQPIPGHYKYLLRLPF
jgi:hypothetical protein